MKPAPFTYHCPASLAEALAMLAGQPNARVLAGGQSLMAMLNLRLANPEHLIDIGRIAELSGICDDGDGIVIGAMTRQRDIERSLAVQSHLPLLTQAIAHVGHQQTRNWGTIGGSLCHLDPTAEIPAVALACDAELKVQSLRGTRVIAMRDFPLAMMTPALEPDEMLVSIRFPKWPKTHGAGFAEFARRHGDFSIAAAAVLLSLDATGRVERTAISVSGVAPTPLRLAAAEHALTGNAPTPALLAAAAADALKPLEVMDDPFYPSWYRKRVAGTVLTRALSTALETARELA
jgi:carbon-monoxide dehydrogenase medium subunit